MLGPIFDHQMSVYVLNGTHVHFTFREVLKLYRSWQLWAVIPVGFVVMATGHPVTAPQFDSFELRMLFWTVALAAYLGFSVPHGIAADYLWRKVTRHPVPMIVASAPLVMGSSALAAVLVSWFAPDQSWNDALTWQLFLRSVVVAHVFETLALVWLIPAQRAREEQIAPERTVMLGGQRFDLARIERVKAAEHYLEIYSTDNGVETVRERMGTFLEQVRDTDGVQTHRSHWIAASAAGDVRGSVMALPNGIEVPIARGRAKAVQAWFAAHVEPAANPAE